MHARTPPGTLHTQLQLAAHPEVQHARTHARHEVHPTHQCTTHTLRHVHKPAGRQAGTDHLPAGVCGLASSSVCWCAGVLVCVHALAWCAGVLVWCFVLGRRTVATAVRNAAVALTCPAPVPRSCLRAPNACMSQRCRARS